ncbi:maleylpyruvate isomerase family mycothiol-dependent enzyme [Nocardia arthritidis]|uniref:Maleylpyruvate isomerase family mycothiol-dependent enzyme n=1 Tax=Nocardia arthritidis TaxID=228602 RepID=A0A6G9YJL3_9NOCA|nr:maleylpyruvate isomerase family mycothiol-dependent enzyme [Nocardia arthritidis]QIS13381.1 maleylpyruvate isomerase family mycothiol-dependent enzyme [Nocardia arthritidis]
MDPVADAVRTMARRFAELAAAAPDQNRSVAATPGWSIGDVLGHVAMEPSRYRELALGRGEWPARAAELPAFNAEQIRTLPTRDPEKLAARLIADTDDFLETVAAGGPDLTMMFDGDQRIRADRARGTLLAEFIVHGHDIAATLGRPWSIDPAHVPIVMDGLTQVIPGWVDPARSGGHTASYELRLRGLNRYFFRFTAGQVTIGEPGPVDVHISAEPVTLLLLNYGRLAPWKPALTGKVLAWGRKPWLALGFNRRFLPA